MIFLRIREVLRIIYGEQAEAIEAEACSILGVSSTCGIFQTQSAKGFFDDHIKKYSKSRRKAPIYYWKLSSNKGNYSSGSIITDYQGYIVSGFEIR